MKNTTLIIFLVLLALLGINGCSSYNGMVNKDENVSQAWSNVQSAYQRRADLIPNLVNTVKGYAEHEKSTLEAVVNARAKATSMNIDPSNLTPEMMKKFQEAQQGLSGALSRLLVSVEKYPDLKANQNFLELQSQLESTENRINVERNRFNEAVTVYNKTVRKFPNNIYAGLFGFTRKATFESKAGSEEAPKVNF
ncbi:MAG TPA: LemA family protein [Saprospiraceae bacterium]|nr:LemA family protein [Saprospiraceae bacterium]